MPLSYKEITELFDRARSEMYIPPITSDVTITRGSVEIDIKGNVARLKIPEEILYDPEGGPILLWYFRHNLAHMHYCPYNLRTIQTLAKAAFQEVKSWSIAHNAVKVFADLQIDLLYLPLKYGQAPLHIFYEFESKPKGLDEFRYAAYKRLFGKMLKMHKIDPDASFYGTIASEVILSSRSWISKIKIIAALLKKLQALNKLKRLESSTGRNTPLYEDLEADMLNEASIAMSGVSKEEARELYRHWIKHRVNIKEIEKKFEGITKGQGSEKVSEIEVKTEKGTGEEPELPSTLSKPLSKFSSAEDAVWKALWYKARAQELIIEYGGYRRGGTWAVYAYPDLWLVEDDLEDLDVEASLEEGSLIPEETTLKAVNLPSPAGEIIIQEQVPAVLVVLDTSRSMLGAIDDAAIAAFAAYLNAKKAGGKVAIVNFSTKYIAVGWEEQDFWKELALSISQGELTILPLGAIKILVNELEHGESAFIVLVTDCGWQNLREALGFLENLASKGHNVVVFHIEGWKYPKSLEAVSRIPNLTFYRVRDPSLLRYLVLSELKRSISTSVVG
ncbi:MAG: hypothetical protein QW291_05985 [Thermofilaceae archaeon]